MVTVPTNVQKNVQSVYRKCVGYKQTYEDLCEKYIKFNMGIR